MKQLKHPLSALSLFITILVLTSQAFAGLVLNPQRIVLQDRERSASLDLLNTSEEMGRYQIYFEHKIMKEDGSIVDIANPEEGGPYAGDMIRYSPRRVDIKAGGSQTIRLAARRPKNLPNGEYLSHLVLKQIPNTSVVDKNTADSDNEEKQLNLAVQPILKLAIPVIIRKGQLKTLADIENITPIKTGSLTEEIHFTLLRNGNFSLYGNVALFEKTTAGLGQRIGFIRGIALYNPTLKRLVKVRLDTPQDLKGKTLLLRYEENQKYGGTNLIEKTVSF
jgi:P pilus assembly chaperone PapD